MSLLTVCTHTAVASWILLSVGAATPAVDRLSVEPVTSPASSGTAEPQFTSSGNRALLSWVETAGTRATLKFSEWTGSAWGQARTVVSTDKMMVNSADVPSVIALSDGTLAAHWMEQNGPDPEAYDLRLQWSRDEGRTWSAPAAPHHDRTETQHGFASLFEVPGGGLGIVWLDGRATHPELPENQQGAMMLRGATYARQGVEQREAAVDARVCECCSTAATASADGVLVAYRNRSAGEIRDIYVTRLASGRWTVPVRVHDDGWKIEGCPVNGPALAARGRDAVVAWFTAAKDEGRTLLAFSHDGGRTFGTPIRIDDDGSQGRVGVGLADDGSAVVSWIEFKNDTAELRVRRIAPDGSRSPSTTIAPMSGTRYPRVTIAGAEVLVAWTDSTGDSSTVRTAHATIR